MAESDTKRGQDISQHSQAGLTLIKSIYAMTLPGDSDGGAQLRDSTESDESRKQTSSVPISSFLNVNTGDENVVEEKKKKGDKEERGEFTKELQTMMIGTRKMYPLHFPIDAEHMVTLLKTQKDLDLNGYNNMLQAPIHAIVQRKCNNAKEMEDKMNILYNFLTYSNANVDFPTGCTSRTALHLAADECDIQSVKVLLAFNANVNPLDRDGKTPLDLIKEICDPNTPISPTPSYFVLSEDPLNSLTMDTVLTAFADPHLSVSLEGPKFENKERYEVFHLLKSHGGTYGRDVQLLPSNPTTVFSPMCDSLLRDISFLSTSRQSMPRYIEKLVNSIKYCESEVSRVVDLTDLDGTINPSDAATLAQSMKKLKIYKQAGSRILCLDGGGMRGLIQTEILARIEAMTGRKVTELFDWIIGTSVGGIVALSLVYGGVSYVGLTQIVGKIRTDVFGNALYGVHGDSIAIEGILKDYLPENMRMCDVTYPRVLITAVIKSSENLKLAFFNNCFNDEYSTELIWKVGRYTSAAPVYITEMDNYVDGGVLANNPAMTGITHIQSYYQEKYGCSLPISLVVSVGTGIQPESPLGNTDLLQTNSWFFFLSEISLMAEKAKNLLSLLTSAVTNVQNVCDVCHSYCEQLAIPYFRFNIPLDSKLDTFFQNVEDIVDLLLKTRQHFENSPQIKELVLKFHNVATASQEVHKMIFDETSE